MRNPKGISHSKNCFPSLQVLNVKSKQSQTQCSNLRKWPKPMFCCMKAEISAVGRPHAQEHQPPMKSFKGLEIQWEFLRKGSDTSRTEKNSPLDEHPVLMLNCCGFLSFLSNRVRSSCFHCPSVLGNHYQLFCQMQEISKMRTVSTYSFCTLPVIVAQPSLGKIRVIFLWILNWGFWSRLRTRSSFTQKKQYLSLLTPFLLFSK